MESDLSVMSDIPATEASGIDANGELSHGYDYQPDWRDDGAGL